MAVVIYLIALFLMLFLGFPIYICLTGASFIYVLLNPELSFVIAIQKMVNAPSTFTLLAIPFFILAGQIMNNGGITNRIFKFAKTWVGHYHGGLGYVNVFSSVIFAGMSGSAMADAGGLGMVEIEAMRRENYDDDFTIGVTAASSIIGPIIPPSIPFVVYGAVAGVSIGGLFIGGVVPGLVMAGLLCVMVYFKARQRNYPLSPKAKLIERMKAFLNSFFALLTPVVIIGGIWGGLFTPTEAALASIIYAILVTVFIYREGKIKTIPGMMVETIKVVAPAIALVAAANLFGWIMNYERIDQLLIKVLFSITRNKYVILMIVNLILIVLGMFLEVISAIMLMLPILGPIVSAINIHPIHFGVMMCLNLMIGLLTPPVGYVLYVLAAMTKNSANEIIRMILPWIIPLMVALVLVAFVPALSMFLPTIMGFAN